jgi:hypothetical protein
MVDENDRPLPVTLHLDPAAEELFERYELELALAQERRKLGTSEDAENQAAYLGWLSKFAGQTARLAACLHAAEHWTESSTVNTTVSAGTVAAAIELARYLHGHALVVFGLMGELPEQRRAVVILDWLRSRSVHELAMLTVRDVHRSRSKGTSVEQVKSALRLLEQHGYVRIEKVQAGKTGGRPSERVHVAPALSILSASPDETDPTSSELGSVGSVGRDAKDPKSDQGDPSGEPGA